MSPVRVVPVGRWMCPEPVELRRACEVAGLDPPSVVEARACMRAWARCDPGWADAFLEERRVARSVRADALFGVLRRLAPDLGDEWSGEVWFAAERARQEALALDLVPRVLVMVRADRSVVVADLVMGSVQEFGGRARWWGWGR